jgi:transposase
MGGKTHSPYPQEFKQTIVDLVHAGRKPQELAKEFGCSVASIDTWVKRADANGGKRVDVLTSDEREELRRARKEIRQLRLEREILSKAAAWFARETGKIPNDSSDS